MLSFQTIQLRQTEQYMVMTSVQLRAPKWEFVAGHIS